MYALVDCANFFVSCERIFQPRLEKQPVVVLSSNDGCAISRSEEAKALGVLMGAPLFTFQKIVHQHQVKVFSSNFALYGDISRRVMHILKSYAPQVEVYSVDESFVKFPEHGISDHLLAWAKQIRQTMAQWVGIPVRIGLGPTKTLAKLANYWAKQCEDGILYLDSTYTHLLQNTPVKKVWGIGDKMSQALEQKDIKSAYEFMNLSDMWLRRKFSVLGLRKAYELRGIDCDESYAHREHKKSMMITRSFGSPLTDADRLQEIIALFITRAGEKLRQQKLKTNVLTLMLKTSPFAHSTYQSHCLSMTLEEATDDTIILLKAAQKIFAQIYQKGTLYKKAGILMEPLTQETLQQKLFSTTNSRTKQRHKLYEMLDQVNRKWGRGTLRPASCGTKHQTSLSNMTKHENLSPAFTTSWKELLMVK